MENINENEQKEVEEKKPEQPAKEDTQPQRKWGPQIIGATIGAFIFLIAGGLANQLGWVTGSTSRWWLWGAVLGGLVGSGDSLNNSGRILTKKDNKWLNIAVSLVGMLIFFGIIFALSGLAGWLLSLFNF